MVIGGQEKERDRDRDRDRDRERDRQTDRQTETERERQRERDVPEDCWDLSECYAMFWDLEMDIFLKGICMI